MIYTYHNLQESVPRKRMLSEIFNRVVGLQTSSQIQHMLKDLIALGQEVPPMEVNFLYYRWHNDPAIGENPVPSRSGWYQSASKIGGWKPADSVAHVPLESMTYYLTSLQRKV
jgi:hypothetical protein